MKELIQREAGATLVEMLVAMSISVLVFGIITTAMVQFMLVTRWGNSQLQISNDFQVANLWLGRDIPEASSFTPGAGTEYGTFNWADSSQQFRYSYDLVKGELIREYLVGGIVQSTITVARYIANQGDVVFSLSGKLMTVSITSTSGDEVESIDIQLAMRTR
jgi:type II secretory pathway component PulJ